jgi:hypothetical protein
MIGSMLENWITRDVGPRCRFDNIQLPINMIDEAGKRATVVRALLSEQFCGPACREAFEKVVEARAIIGKRDLHRRGFD